MTNLITITENANQHLTELSKEHNKKYVRLEVKGGGCAGFKYEWSFEDNKDDNDEVLKYENFTLLIDKSSILMLAGMTVEYRKEIFGSFLELKNPNATSTCGCGESFGAQKDIMTEQELQLFDNAEINLPLDKDYEYQMNLLKKQLQMILDDERGDLDLCKKIEVLTIENKILKEKNKFLNDTIKDIGILTKE